MSLTISGAVETGISLEREGERLHKDSLDKMRTYMHKMIRSARSNAPIKKGYLENAIMFLGEEIGYRGRKSLVWGVNENRLNPASEDRYDITMEYGSYNLGRRSQEKEDDGHDVGPGYLMRAVWEWEEELKDELEYLASQMR